jgi:hypothetical protein
MHTLSSLVLLSTASNAWGYGWVASQAGVDSSLLREARYANQKRQTSCPFNPDHKGAAPYSDKYPYTGAKNGAPGTGKGGIKVRQRNYSLHLALTDFLTRYLLMAIPLTHTPLQDPTTSEVLAQA